MTHAAAFFLPISPHCTKYGGETACVSVVAGPCGTGYDLWPPAARGTALRKGRPGRRVVERNITTDGNAE